MKKWIVTLLCVTLALALCVGCTDASESSSSSVAVDVVDIEEDDMFTDRDLSGDYDASEATNITLTTSSVTIDTEGTYIISGSLSNGQIIVDAEDAKVQLVLNGVDITCETSAPIYIKNADKVFITLASGTSNTVAVTDSFVDIDENSIDGAIYSKCDLTFNGTGSLSVTSLLGHGIVAKDDLVFASGTFSIFSASHGINANDSIRIYSGTFTIDSGKDGMQADNEDNEDKGFIYILDGTFTIDSDRDSVQASSTLLIKGGTFTLTSGGGFDEVLNDLTVGEGSGSSTMATDLLPYSMKCFKANDIQFDGGTYYLSSYEDAIHANNTYCVINDGTFEIYSGDDAIHSDDSLIINGGDITIVEGYEGIEGHNSLTINGGNISVNIYDDALNVGSSSGTLTITGGYIYLACQGDGIDTNGDFVMTGGTVILDVDAIYTAGDGEFDISGSITYTGGEIYDEKGNTLTPSTSSTSSSGGSSSFFPTITRR
ncbi:MAG: carbohydrate-binding domain-containing protein [Bacillota bacterium]